MSSRLVSGQEVVAMSDEWLQKMKEDQSLYKHGMVRIMPQRWLLTGTAPFFLDKIQSFKFRADDIVVMTFPKCGTTWMQEILWTMTFNPDLNNPRAHEELLLRSPEISLDMMFDAEWLPEGIIARLEKVLHHLCPERRPEDGVLLQMLELMPGPRIIKNHYPFSLMPVDLLHNTKVVYVARNPKDMLVSFYHFMRGNKAFSYTGSFEKFVKQFMQDEVMYTPFWPHVQEAWERRHHPNLHFVFYEEMKADIMSELRKLNNFIGTNLNQQQLENIAHHTTFSNMKSQETPNKKYLYHKEKLEESGGFFRKGTVGDWKNHFSPELLQEVDQWIEKNTAHTGKIFKMDQ